MKHIFIAAMLISSQLFAQDPEQILREKEETQKKSSVFNLPLPLDSKGEVTYQRIDSVLGTPETLYSRAKMFIADYYKSYKSVTQLNDDKTNVIIINPNIPILLSYPLAMAWKANIRYQLKIECKTDKYRQTITNILIDDSETGRISTFSNTKAKGYTEGSWKKLLVQGNSEFLLLQKSLTDFMQINHSDF